MNPEQYPEAIKECWAVHQVFRKLGFEAKDIYVATGKDARCPGSVPALFVVLKAQGTSFTVTVGRYDSEVEVEADLALWAVFVELLSDKSRDEAVLTSIYESSLIVGNIAQFLMALHAKGITPSEEWS
jgi:hypothetical protein